jgi:hypothetical protein
MFRKIDCIVLYLYLVLHLHLHLHLHLGEIAKTHLVKN